MMSAPTARSKPLGSLVSILKMAEASAFNASASCVMPEMFWTFREKIYFSVYYNIIPIFFVAGLVGHVLCIGGLIKQTKVKKENAYVYQIYVEISEIGELVAFALYTLTIKWWSGAEDVGAVWYRRSYAMMWFAARLATPVSNILITTTLLLSLATAADRTLALSKPYLYKAMNRKWWETFALTSCILLGITSTLFAVKRYKIRDADYGIYEIYVDEEYASTVMVIILSNIRNVLRTAGVIALISCNAAIVVLYRSYVRRTNSSRRSRYRHRMPPNSPAQIAIRDRTEHMLTVMAIVESATTATGMLALTAYFLAIFTKPSFTSCGGLLMIPIVDLVLQGSNIAKFFIIVSVNNKFRKIVISILPRRLRSFFRGEDAYNIVAANAEAGETNI